jgi:phosphoglycolate phosphatase-like HAD superfamily hydrolase
MKLILFDIDGTIMDSGGAGTRALNLAFEELFSVKDAFQGIRMSGKTDTEIMKEALRKHGLPSSDGTIPRAVESYLKHLCDQINNDRKRLKPGVLDLLELLSGRPDCRLGLLTGNLEQGARIKLGAFGLNRYFSISGGGGSQTPLKGGAQTPLPLPSKAPFKGGSKTRFIRDDKMRPENLGVNGSVTLDNHEGKGDYVPFKSANKVYIDSPHGKVDHVPLHGVPSGQGLKSRLNLNASNNPGERDCGPEEGDSVQGEWDHVPVPFGAFGSDDEDRNRLLPIAVEKFLALTGMRVGYADCVVIGDTPRDVLCAKPYGAVALAVATGGYSMEELKEAGADVVMEDLRKGYDYLAGVI